MLDTHSIRRMHHKSFSLLHSISNIWTESTIIKRALSWNGSQPMPSQRRVANNHTTRQRSVQLQTSVHARCHFSIRFYKIATIAAAFRFCDCYQIHTKYRKRCISENHTLSSSFYNNVILISSCTKQAIFLLHVSIERCHLRIIISSRLGDVGPINLFKL